MNYFIAMSIVVGVDFYNRIERPSVHRFQSDTIERSGAKFHETGKRLSTLALALIEPASKLMDKVGYVSS